MIKIGNKLFYVCIVFLINTNLVFGVLFTFGNIFSLAKLDEEYRVYEDRIKRTSVAYKQPYLKILTKEQLFDLNHNIEFRRIPEKSDKWIYSDYTRKYNSYCNSNHSTYDAFVRDNQYEILMYEAFTLISCLDNNQDVLSSSSTKIKRSFNKLKSKRADFIPYDVAIEDNQQCKEREKSLKSIISNCLVGEYKPLKNKCSFNFVLNSQGTKINPDNDNIIQCLIDCLPDNLIIRAHTCIASFLKKIPETDSRNRIRNFPVDAALIQTENIPVSYKTTLLKQFNYKDLIIVMDVIYFEKFLNLKFIIKFLFEEYRNPKAVTKLLDEIKKCIQKRMTKVEYTAVQMMYRILPDTVDINYVTFKKKIMTLVNKLKVINKSEKNNNDLYDVVKTHLEYIDEKYYIKLRGIRAIQSERDYIIYALRLIMRGYMPLTTSLWEDERRNIEKFGNEVDYTNVTITS